MRIMYTAPGRESVLMGARLPYEGEALESIIEMYSPVRYWQEQETAVVVPDVGATGTLIPPDSQGPGAPQRPSVCTPAQGLIALYAFKGITEADITGAIERIADQAQRYTAQIGYTRATTWERESATMQALAALLGLTEEDLDALFTYAVGVRV